MKKCLFALMAFVFFAQYGVCIDTTSISVMKNIKDAVVSDITNTASDTLTTNVNNVKLAAYKTQLSQKEKELEEVEESSSLALVKCYKKVKIKRKIAELEANIEEIENQ